MIAILYISNMQLHLIKLKTENYNKITNILSFIIYDEIALFSQPFPC